MPTNNKSKDKRYGVWRTLAEQEEIEERMKQQITDKSKKPTFEQTIKAMANTSPISNKDILNRKK